MLPRQQSEKPRHAAYVRVTHWITLIAFVALVVSGFELVISHPRFYLGETGNVNTTPLFSIHIPASRDTVPTGYAYTMPDQNGWSRYLHFQAAWVLVLAGFIYLAAGLWTRHFRNDLIPAAGQPNLRSAWTVISSYVLRRPPDPAEASSYNALQRVSYLVVIFGLFPMLIWTGLAMSPSFTSAFPLTVVLLGGKQTARTLHFFLTWAVLLFVVVHVAMVIHAGFWSRMRAMITGHAAPSPAPSPAPALPSDLVQPTGARL